ncbi:hypothetical protein EIN_260640 [Entamoeba invadens IP1]|uniref:Uncharacterized protein n=1 Tax=Entamoeba invadens IP1 TaxID=370355 RepID=L7FPH3_ENTIV|nr:hypothetical protein EIN_260640 [Entamoeba invadens IP1]ELP95343.1 hypothetical protein EIN_260640 [Entamoeba invadens IP1]|eukprot:XP_004262114.1 hypothetical protein EIN_260640 [Entamoeba invadens IP1]
MAYKEGSWYLEEQYHKAAIELIKRCYEPAVDEQAFWFCIQNADDWYLHLNGELSDIAWNFMLDFQENTPAWLREKNQSEIYEDDMAAFKRRNRIPLNWDLNHALREKVRMMIEIGNIPDQDTKED